MGKVTLNSENKLDAIYVGIKMLKFERDMLNKNSHYLYLDNKIAIQKEIRRLLKLYRKYK